jgi:hypothetical protein
VKCLFIMMKKMVMIDIAAADDGGVEDGSLKVILF